MPFGWFKKSSKFDVNTNLDKESFFVITAIFNPASYESRYTLYHQFAQHMKETGAHLITIECIFPALDQHEFQVTDSKNPNHIQIKSKSVYWVKENLINIAVSRLPPHAKYVCWLDADITFKDKNWIDLTVRELSKYTVVQVFKKANFLGPPPHNKVLRTDYSFGYSVVHRKPIDQNRYDEWYPHSGYGWAMDITAFRSIGGLPDFDIVGSGDLHFAFALLNRVSNALEEKLNPEFKNFVLAHSQQAFQKLQEISSSKNKGIVGYVPMSISHNWHGSRQDRQYVNRWKILIAHQFNYMTDMTRNSDGLLQLNEWEDIQPSGLSNANLQLDILTHFKMRNEDRKTATDHDRQIIGTKKPAPAPAPKKHNKSKGFSDKDDDSRRRRQRDNDNHGPYFVPDSNCYPYPGDNDNNCPHPGNGHHPCPHPEDNGCHDHGHNDHHGDYGNDYHGSVDCTSQY